MGFIFSSTIWSTIKIFSILKLQQYLFLTYVVKTLKVNIIKSKYYGMLKYIQMSYPVFFVLYLKKKYWLLGSGFYVLLWNLFFIGKIIKWNFKLRIFEVFLMAGKDYEGSYGIYPIWSYINMIQDQLILYHFPSINIWNQGEGSSRNWCYDLYFFSL